MKNLPKEKRDRLVLIVVSALMILIGLWQGVLGIQEKKLLQLSQQMDDARTELNKGTRVIERKVEFQESLAQKSEQLKAIEAGMASGDMYSWIISKINAFKADYDVEIPQFSREIPLEVGMFPKFPYRAAQFNIRGKAHYHDFGRFIADFENEFPYLQVQNVSLVPANSSAATGAEEAEDSEKLAFRMEIVTLINPNAY
jgi:hypothetical protein